MVERDAVILRECDRWNIVLGRHLCCMASFSGQRACDRRLHKLIEAGYLKREKIIYGVPGIYRLTPLGKSYIGIPNRKEQIRLEQVSHDIAVCDTALFFHRTYGVSFSSMQTEKQLHQSDGFGVRCHRPDFVFMRREKLYCVEVELSLKSKARFQKNILDNFSNYERQFWVVPDLHTRIYTFLAQMKEAYPNIVILSLSEVQKNE